MAIKWRRLRLALLISVLAVAVLAALYHFLVGWPATPMTVARAERLFGEGLRPGQSRDEIEAWLSSRGIPPGVGWMEKHSCYSVHFRRDEEVLKDGWMDQVGKKSVAARAGLDGDAVFSIIRVCYPDASREPLGFSRINVYLFFDEHDQLLRHWVDEFLVTL